MAIISANAVTRMGMGGAMWQPHGSYSGKVAGVIPEDAFRGGGSSGRYYTWAPEELPEGDFVRKYSKTAHDDELERLLKQAILREDLAKKAAHIASKAASRVTSVQDIARAADHVGKEVLNLQQRHIVTQREAEKRLRKLKEEEDLIISILLSDI